MNNDPFLEKLNEIKRLIVQRKKSRYDDISIYCALCDKNVQYTGANYHLKYCHQNNLEKQLNKPKNNDLKWWK
jgi:hypothetical protein